MYTSSTSHIALIVIEPVLPYKVRLRCSCGWKNINYIGYLNKYQESYWNVANEYALDKLGLIEKLPQRARIKKFFKQEHPQAMFLEYLYEDSLELAKMTTEKLN